MLPRALRFKRPLHHCNACDPEAVRKDRDAKVELNHRGQVCEFLADTGISRRIEMVRTAGNAPAFSCSRSKRLTFRLRSGKLPSALNPISGHYSDRARSLSADPVQLRKMARQAEALAKVGRASGYRALYSCLEGRRVSLNTYARDELESRKRVARFYTVLQTAA